MISFNQRLLRHTARAWGLQPSYLNNEGQFVWSQEKTLVKMLGDLSGKTIHTDDDLKNLIAQKRDLVWNQAIEPAQVLWNGQSTGFTLYSTQELKLTDIIAEIEFEDGQTQKTQVSLLLTTHPKRGWKYRLRLMERLPIGYHRLHLKTPAGKVSTLLICPPEKLIDNPTLMHSWGPFVPLYAVRTKNDLGMGSLKELSELSEHVSAHGAKWVGTLPLLAGNFDNPDCDPSPYSALTRLFWNELYLDLEKLLLKYNIPAATELFNSNEFKAESNRLRDLKYVDYYGVYQHKKKILQILSDSFFTKSLDKTTAFQAFAQDNPEIYAYAKFRAKDLSGQQFHQFVQFEMNEQLREISQKSKTGLYLDFPVGVNDAGFDFHHFKNVFFAEVSVGAPPEPVFQLGQDWGFPSFHPIRHRAEGYSYFRKSLRNHLKYAKILRLDHVMGLYRIYAVPKGFSGKDGLYLRFPPEELLAIAILEAHRAGASFVGENLGTVPVAVNQIMQQRNVKGMWVLQMEMWQTPENAAKKMPTAAMASFNTHDMPMFETFLQGTDLDLVADLKILAEEYKEPFKKDREKQKAQWQKYFKKTDFTLSALEWLAASKTDFLVVNLEDLWKELEPQNIPGTWKEYPNWRRRYAKTIESWVTDVETKKAMTALGTLRN